MTVEWSITRIQICEFHGLSDAEALNAWNRAFFRDDWLDPYACAECEARIEAWAAVRRSVDRMRIAAPEIRKLKTKWRGIRWRGTRRRQSNDFAGEIGT